MTNIIFIDFDDTIFPTTWLSNVNIFYEKEYFQLLEEINYNLFTKLLRYGKIIIVTNAKIDWVYKSINDYLPKLKFLLKDIEIISARERYEGIYSCPTFWKKNVFKDIIFHILKENNYIYQSNKTLAYINPYIDNNYKGFPLFYNNIMNNFIKGNVSADNIKNISDINIISIGDSEYEHMAILELRQLFPKMNIKSVKLIDRPHITSIIKQLSNLYLNIDYYLYNLKSNFKYQFNNNNLHIIET